MKFSKKKISFSGTYFVVYIFWKFQFFKHLKHFLLKLCQFFVSWFWSFIKRYEFDSRVIFDQWAKLHLGLDVQPEIPILKGLYSGSCTMSYLSVFILNSKYFLDKLIFSWKGSTTLQCPHSWGFNCRWTELMWTVRRIFDKKELEQSRHLKGIFFKCTPFQWQRLTSHSLHNNVSDFAIALLNKMIF